MRPTLFFFATFFALCFSCATFAQETIKLAPRFAQSETVWVEEEALYEHNWPFQRYSLSQESAVDAKIKVERFKSLEEASETTNAITPHGSFLKFTHYGPYETIDQTYEEIADYLDERSLTAKDEVVEEFVQRAPLFKENDFVTHIYVQVKQ